MDGVFNVLKPPGMTSSNAVADVRRLIGEKRVGHTGTLDPGAAGVLPICVGKATRLFDYLVEKDKVYRAELTFGTATDTLDAYGIVIARDDKIVTEAEIHDAIASLTGEITQIPPMYSAIKLGGKKLYELARSGVAADVSQKVRKVTIHSMELIARTGENSFLIDVHCSKGTYIRTLCEQIAEAVHTVAYMSFLLRTRSGTFEIQESRAIAELDESALVPMDVATGFLPRTVAPVSFASKLRNGNSVNAEDLIEACAQDKPCRVYCGDAFCGIGMISNGKLIIKALLSDRF